MAFGGLGILVLLVAFDGAFDFFDGEPILPAFAVFVSLSGFGGLLTKEAARDNMVVFILIPFVLAALVSVTYHIFYKKFKKAVEENGDFPNQSTLVGTKAKVSWWSGNSGEVVASWMGQPHKMEASSTEEFTQGDVVVISEILGEKNGVFVASAALAGLSCFFVSPNPEYLRHRYPYSILLLVLFGATYAASSLGII